MFIPRGVLLTLIVILVFSPAILNWINYSPIAWYRPFFAWAGLILLVYLAQRYRQQRDDRA